MLTNIFQLGWNHQLVTNRFGLIQHPNTHKATCDDWIVPIILAPWWEVWYGISKVSIFKGGYCIGIYLGTTPRAPGFQENHQDYEPFFRIGNPNHPTFIFVTAIRPGWGGIHRRYTPIHPRMWTTRTMSITYLGLRTPVIFAICCTAYQWISWWIQATRNNFQNFPDDEICWKNITLTIWCCCWTVSEFL